MTVLNVKQKQKILETFRDGNEIILRVMIKVILYGHLVVLF